MNRLAHAAVVAFTAPLWIPLWIGSAVVVMRTADDFDQFIEDAQNNAHLFVKKAAV
ncbi:hypothetical protein LQ327_08845 [Actinomycetospora endophytica]|uniref:Uncharacterized protein n=1 Tax=Actinomycetospora endophytica TaxID=2291215 RepID=A0ABS8P5F6_9PSEU|nr:hypothetical protein [Actinomycetospora endophytica]MCD2193488.1 hypothetical protein [Actinomycetospora endophytica]